MAIRPVLHYSEWRRAYVLRLVGEKFGPVFVRRGVESTTWTVDRQAVADRLRRPPENEPAVAERGPAVAVEPRKRRIKLGRRHRPRTEVQRRDRARASQAKSPSSGAPVAKAAPAPAPAPAGTARDPRPRERRRPRPSFRGSLSRAPTALLAAFGVAVTAAAVGLTLLNPTGGPSPRSQPRLTAGALQLPVPVGWTRAAPPAARTLGLVDGVALRTKPDASGTLIVGRATTTAGLLPEQLSATLVNTPAPQLVTLGGARYYRYLDVTPRAGGGSESVYTLPTTEGTVLAICIAHRPDANLAARCEHVLGAARLTAGTTIANPEPAYAAAFAAVIRKLNAVRTSAAHHLSNAHDAQQQASAAAALAAGHLQAAAALGRLNAGPASGVNAAVATAIRAIGTAYQSLGQAAARGDTTAYDAARAEVSHTTLNLDSAFTRLRALGYAVRTTPA
jgi:hypothetical protein